jgi:hypothetical protein
MTQLKSGGIDVILRRNDQNFIYGVTYVDHKSKCVFNGSDLGKEFSAAMIRDRWEHSSSGSGSVEERVLPSKQPQALAQTTTDSRNTILEELTGSTSGFNNQLPYQLRKKRKRKNRKL